MTAQTRAVNKARYENGDQPQGSDYVDLIDSFLSLADTTAQSLTSNLEVPTLIASTVTADNVNASAVSTTLLTATTAHVSALEVSGNAHISGNLDVDGTIQIGSDPIGNLYIDTTAAVSASASYVEMISSSSVISTFMVDFESSAGSLVYTGTNTRNFLAIGEITLEASAANTDTILTLGVNGSALSRLEQERELAATAAQISLSGPVRLAQNDRVSILIKGSDSGAVGWKVDRVNLVVKG